MTRRASAGSSRCRPSSSPPPRPSAAAARRRQRHSPRAEAPRETHRSPRLGAAAAVYARALLRTLLAPSSRARGDGGGDDGGGGLATAAAAAGAELGLDLAALLLADPPDSRVAFDVFGPACYIGDALPVILHLAHKYARSAAAASSRAGEGEAFRRALLANANAGGETAHRGAALGALMGAVVGRGAIPSELIQGLTARRELESEIGAVVELYAGQRPESRSEL